MPSTLTNSLSTHENVPSLIYIPLTSVAVVDRRAREVDPGYLAERKGIRESVVERVLVADFLHASASPGHCIISFRILFLNLSCSVLFQLFVFSRPAFRVLGKLGIRTIYTGRGRSLAPERRTSERRKRRNHSPICIFNLLRYISILSQSSERRKRGDRLNPTAILRRKGRWAGRELRATKSFCIHWPCFSYWQVAR